MTVFLKTAEDSLNPTLLTVAMKLKFSLLGFFSVWTFQFVYTSVTHSATSCYTLQQQVCVTVEIRWYTWSEKIHWHHYWQRREAHMPVFWLLRGSILSFLPLFFPFFPFHFLPLLYLLFPALSHSSPSHFPYFPTPFPSAEGGIGLLVLPVLQRLGDA